MDDECHLQEELLQDIPGRHILPTLYRRLQGRHVNLEYPLYNGTTVKFMNDKDIYLGNQIERQDSERCYGVVADENFILVCEYGCNGVNPEIVLYKRR